MRPPARNPYIAGRPLFDVSCASRSDAELNMGSVTTRTAPTRRRVISAKTFSKSLGIRASKGSTLTPNHCATATASWSRGRWVGLAGFTRMARDGLLEQLHLLAHQLGAEIAHARDVAAGPGKAGHEAYGHGIGWVDRDNGNGTSAMLGGEGGFRGDHDDDIDLEPNLLGFELRQPLGPEF